MTPHLAASSDTSLTTNPDYETTREMHEVVNAISDIRDLAEDFYSDAMGSKDVLTEQEAYETALEALTKAHLSRQMERRARELKAQSNPISPDAVHEMLFGKGV